jgi:hypothetical protein
MPETTSQLTRGGDHNALEVINDRHRPTDARGLDFIPVPVGQRQFECFTDRVSPGSDPDAAFRRIINQAPYGAT